MSQAEVIVFQCRQASLWWMSGLSVFSGKPQCGGCQAGISVFAGKPQCGGCQLGLSVFADKPQCGGCQLGINVFAGNAVDAKH